MDGPVGFMDGVARDAMIDEDGIHRRVFSLPLGGSQLKNGLPLRMELTLTRST